MLEEAIYVLFCFVFKISHVLAIIDCFTKENNFYVPMLYNMEVNLTFEIFLIM